MKRKSKFAVFMLSAAITVGALFATVGKPCYMKHHTGCERMMHHNHLDENKN